MAKPAEIPLKGRGVTYRYTALTSQGRLVKGNIPAANDAMAEQALIEKGLKPVSLELVAPRLSLERLFPTLFGVKGRETIVFSRQLATLLDAGVTLVDGLQVLREQAGGSKGFKKILGSMSNDLGTGVSFSQAVSKHPQVFSDIYCKTIAVGEQTGSMETSLRQMADYLEKHGAVTKKVTKALTYPVLILSMAVVVVLILMTTALPSLINMFTAMDVALPLPTRILIAVTNFLTAYKFYILIGVVLAALLGVYWVKQASGRRQLDRLLLRAPLIGPPTHMGEVARFSRTMSVLVAAGVPLQETMEMLPQTTSNRVMREALGQVREELLLGHGLSGPMSKIDLFPPLLVQMVSVGEESNTLDITLGSAADFYEIAAEERISSLIGLIQPVSTIVIALVVGFIAMALIMPMYTITGAFS